MIIAHIVTIFQIRLYQNIVFAGVNVRSFEISIHSPFVYVPWFCSEHYFWFLSVTFQVTAFTWMYERRHHGFISIVSVRLLQQSGWGSSDFITFKCICITLHKDLM